MKLRKILLIFVLLMLFLGYGVKADNPNSINDEKIVEKSSDNNLSSIKIDNHELEFFNENVTEYDIEVDKDTDKVNIEAIKKDSKAIVGGDVGTRPLSYGINTFNINVISESGEMKTYILNITRIDERSTDNTLKEVSISDIFFLFNPNVTEYDLDVNNKIDKVTITSTLSDSKSNYVKDFGDREVKLDEGSNKILIKVLSESNEERVYTFNITRALSGNNTLKSLTINNEKINLKDNEFMYSYTVKNEVESVDIKAIPSDNKATINSKSQYELEVGDNEINIEIIAPDGSRASYILTITRKKILSSNSLLSNIKIIGYKINFKPDVTLYNLRINDEDEKLDIYTVPDDTFATVEIEGNNNLIDGSIVKINVKAEDGTYTRYFINIEKSRNNSLLPVIIIIIILGILLALCIMMIIKRKKKKEEIENKIKEEMKKEEDNLDIVGVEMNIEASDYDDVDDSKDEEIVDNQVVNYDSENKNTETPTANSLHNEETSTSYNDNDINL